MSEPPDKPEDVAGTIVPKPPTFGHISSAPAPITPLRGGYYTTAEEPRAKRVGVEKDLAHEEALIVQRGSARRLPVRPDLAQTLANISSVAPPAQQAAYGDLVKKLTSLDDIHLRAFARDNLPIGKRIGVVGIEETTVKSFATIIIDRRDRRRETSRTVLLSVISTLAIGLAGLFVAWVSGKLQLPSP